jgi:hypothetical protein
MITARHTVTLALAGLALAAPAADAAPRVTVAQARALTRATVQVAAASLPTPHSVRVGACRRAGRAVTCEFTLAIGAERCESALSVSRTGRRLRLRSAPVACRAPGASPQPTTDSTPSPGPTNPTTTVAVSPPPLDLPGVVQGGTPVGAPPGV